MPWLLRYLLKPASLRTSLLFWAAVVVCLIWFRGGLTSLHGAYEVTGSEEFVREDLLELQKIAGIRKWRFRYHLPRDRMLFVTLKAELDGKPYPEMTSKFRVVPMQTNVPTSGVITVTHWEKGRPLAEQQPPQWILDITNSGKDWRWSGANSFGSGNRDILNETYVRNSTTEGFGEAYSGVETLADLQPHSFWTVTNYWLEAAEGSPQPQREFKYHLVLQAAEIPSDLQPTGGQVQRINERQ